MKGLQIFVCENQEMQKQECCFNSVISILMVTGFAKVFLSAFTQVEPYWWIFAIGASLLCILNICFCMGKRRDFWLVVECALLLFLFLIRFSDSKNGIFTLSNEFLKFLTGRIGKIYLDYPVLGTDGITYVVALFFALIALLVSRAVALRKIIFVFCLMVLGGIGSIVGFMKIGYGWIFLVIGMILLLVYRRIIEGTITQLWKSCCVSIVILVLCGGVAIGISWLIDFDTEYQVRELQEALHQVWYHDKNNAMPEGDLSDLGGFEKNSQTALTVTMEKPQKLYLRGWVGEVYTGTSWESFGSDINIKSEDMFYWLHKSGFFGQSMISKVTDLIGDEEVYELKITNNSACSSHQYLPYALADNYVLDKWKIGDGTTTFSSEYQTITYTAGSVPQWYEAATYLAQHQSETAVMEYLKQEQTYREFVYANDLQITNSVVGVCNRIFGKDDEEKSLSYILNTIKETLGENLEYDEEVSTLNGKNDFLQYTMEQSKSGYSVHYATAATLMLRYFGVPARYVEGYYISSDEASEYLPGESIALDEAHAHAWTEYYLDGVGWIPFEVTPGYIDEEELTETMQVMEGEQEEGNGKSFYQSPLTYTPPRSAQNNLDSPDTSKFWRFQVKDLIKCVALLIVVVLLMAIVWVLGRRRRLLLFQKKIQELDNRNAITELFGYARMLIGKCNIAESPEWNKVKEINEEALFSNHAMADAQRQAMEVFAKEVIASCKKQCSFWKNIRYHYILWLYR